MELGIIMFRTFFIYFLIIMVYRFMGKREIGQLSIVDFVVSIMIAELAVISIENPEKPMIHSLMGIAILLAAQILFAYVSLKSEKLREIIDGKPSVIIDRGKIDETEMKKQRYNFADLLIQLRENGVSKVSDVEFAILEPTGRLSVIKKDHDDHDDHEERETLYPLPLVLDGKIQEEHLKRLNKSELWLRQELKKLGYRELKKISFCSLESDGIFFIDSKDE
ncbi:DUF421 domain-containing protein [Pseudalkalibacillus berkeleyi]|uniref:DUF421 domain-containing protein n=1 Tax=Pseudalkalibacillus berkeleyi TaxID=1069813 RepID=A0ABS9H346_9BACL|nr:DUF421 domain-containing protein [Pseudalkalibacillus berkeleyi]MCF6138070.1 DUF421 domain-containing protein [Pseudalkalibacillus berkeleyi]